MPTYEYVCTSCDNAWEDFQKISEDPTKVCPKCNEATAKRQISGGNFILKGGGWYADLYSSAKPKSSGSSEGSSSSSGESKSSESKSSESKSSESKSSESRSSGGGDSGGSSGGGSSGSSSGSSSSSSKSDAK